jgi:LPXTG-motif cell wall-anchored protein
VAGETALPFTGSDNLVGTALLGGLLCLAGIALVMSGRRRKAVQNL